MGSMDIVWGTRGEPEDGLSFDHLRHDREMRSSSRGNRKLGGVTAVYTRYTRRDVRFLRSEHLSIITCHQNLIQSYNLPGSSQRMAAHSD